LCGEINKSQTVVRPTTFATSSSSLKLQLHELRPNSVNKYQPKEQLCIYLPITMRSLPQL